MVLFLLMIQLTFISILCSSKIYFTFQVIFFSYFFIHVQQVFSSKFSFFFYLPKFLLVFFFILDILSSYSLLKFLIEFIPCFSSFIKWFNLLLVFCCLPSIFWIFFSLSVYLISYHLFVHSSVPCFHIVSTHSWFILFLFIHDMFYFHLDIFLTNKHEFLAFFQFMTDLIL